MKALITDDSPHIRKELREMVGRSGVEQVFEAADGREALDLLDAERPDLVLLDLVMDRMDGLTFLRKLQERDDPDDHTIIVVSAVDDTRVKKATKALGAARFLEKPVGMDDIRAAVEHVRNQ